MPKTVRTKRAPSRVRVDFRLAPDLLEDLRAVAARGGRTMTSVVERALRRHLATKEALR